MRGARQFARYDLGVDRVRDAERRVYGDKAQIAHVFDVVGGDIRRVAAAQQRFDHAPYTSFSEFVRQLIQMGLSSQDEAFLGFHDVIRDDRSRPVASGLVPEAGLGGERIHEPRLSLCLNPDRSERRWIELLPGLGCVLPEQGRDLSFGKVS